MKSIKRQILIVGAKMNNKFSLPYKLVIFFGLMVAFFVAVYFLYDHSIDESDKGLYKTKRALENLSAAMKNFKSDLGRYPTDIEGLDILAAKTNGFGPYIDHVGVDTWGNRYIYKISSNEVESFLIYSAGQNGVDDSGEVDDIK